MGTIHYSQAIKPDIAYLKKIIENSLLSDWAIRIEYHDGKGGLNCWQLWDNTFFAINSAQDVIQAILNCYAKHPRNTIRLRAEKFQPQTRMLYTVYNPHYLQTEAEFKPVTTTRPLNKVYNPSPTSSHISTQ